MNYVVDWNAVCLICLQEGEMKSIYEQGENNMTLLDKIVKCSSFEVKPGMSIPEQICHLCFDDLNAAYRFRTNCDSTSMVLKSLLSSNICDLEVPTANGETYKYKPPKGLRVKRLTTKNQEEAFIKEETVSDVEDLGTTDTFQISENLDTSESDSDPLKKDDVTEEDTKNETINFSWTGKNDPLDDESNQEARVESRPVRKILKRTKSKAAANSCPIADPPAVKITSVKRGRYSKTDKPPKICDICGNHYKYQHALDSHMRRHRNEKPFPCEFCDKAFVANVELRRHMRVHTGQKPYPCQYCDRRFSDFGSRIKHERTHTGERPYNCPTCGKAFAYAHVLNVHKLTHTGEKKFRCVVCEKGFTKKSYLQGHMKLHGNQIPPEGIIVRIEPQDGYKTEGIIYLQPKDDVNEAQIFYES